MQIAGILMRRPRYFNTNFSPCDINEIFARNDDTTKISNFLPLFSTSLTGRRFETNFLGNNCYNLPTYTPIYGGNTETK